MLDLARVQDRTANWGRTTPDQHERAVVLSLPVPFFGWRGLSSRANASHTFVFQPRGVKSSP